jgi:hypothetical protein
MCFGVSFYLGCEGREFACVLGYHFNWDVREREFACVLGYHSFWGARERESASVLGCLNGNGRGRTAAAPIAFLCNNKRDSRRSYGMRECMHVFPIWEVPFGVTSAFGTLDHGILQHFTFTLQVW